jgi:hypothetical protein
VTPLVLELLAWVAARPLTYGEPMAAWRTSCPQVSVWEDATSAGLVEVVGGNCRGLKKHAVQLTPAGREALARR